MDDATKSGAWPYLAIFVGALAIRALYLVEILVNLGTAELQTGESQAALDAYRRALALEPGLGSARYGAGLALQALGRGGAAAGIFALLVRDPAANESTFQGDAITRLADYRATCRDPEIRDPDEALRLCERSPVAPEFLESARRRPAAYLDGRAVFQDCPF